MRPLLAALLLAAACTSTSGEKAAPPAATIDGLESDARALSEDVNRLARRVTTDVKNGSADAEHSVRDRMKELTHRASELEGKVQGGVTQVTETTRSSLQRTKQQLEALGRELDRQVGQGGTGGP